MFSSCFPSRYYKHCTHLRNCETLSSAPSNRVVRCAQVRSGGDGTVWASLSKASPFQRHTHKLLTLFLQPSQGFSRRWVRLADYPMWIRLPFEAPSFSLSLNLEATSMMTKLALSVPFLNCLLLSLFTDSKTLKNFCVTWFVRYMRSWTRPNADPSDNWLSPSHRKRPGICTESGSTILNSLNCLWVSFPR